jgi:hypothetical protein
LSAPQFKAVFLGLWSKFELVASAGNIGNFDALYQWKDEHEVVVPSPDWALANPGRQVMAIYPDGEWSVLLDFSHCIPADKAELAELSRPLGQVVVMAVGTHGGVMFLDAYEKGQKVRSICYVNGRVTVEGNPLANEHGIHLGGGYLDWADALWKSFGLASFLNANPVGPFEALCVVDRTDYSELHHTPDPNAWMFPRPEAEDRKALGLPPGLRAQLRRRFGNRRRPWWKFW